MIGLFFFGVCFMASVAGGICGIGGGVIIKPVLDAAGIMNVSAINFLSGCTVLSMTTYSVLRSRGNSGGSRIAKNPGIPLAAGAAVGGLAGKNLFALAAALNPDADKVGQIQAVCLLVITVGVSIYTLCKKRIKTLQVNNIAGSVTIGAILGIVSSFLGIGGGPINIMVLFYFYSMSMKTAAANSLYIIFFSQLTNLLGSIFMKTVPGFEVKVLVLMILGGIAGGIAGRTLAGKIRESTVERLFFVFLLGIIGISCFNIYKFA